MQLNEALMSFLNPDLLNYGPVPFWFWNDRINETELKRQVRLMQSQGLRKFIIHARWGLKTPYLSREWWRMVKCAISEAKACGMKAWLYDEYNYPSGIGGFKITSQARFRERFLALSSVDTKGEAVKLSLPKGKLLSLAAYPLLNGKLDASGRVELKRPSFRPPDSKAWRVIAFSMQVEAFKGSGKYSVNYLAPEPTREFIRMTHQAYARELGKDLGTAAPVFFLDEPRFNNALPWDERLPKWFKARKGYDPCRDLALLVHDELKGRHLKLRRDYYGLISDLYCDNFFKPIHAWCKKHKMILTGHLMAEETLAGSTRFSGHGLKPYRHFDIPGMDHLGKGVGGLAPKIVASQAKLSGKDRVICETFAGCGQDFAMDEMNAITHWLFSQGVNVVSPHAFFYAMRTKRQKSDWPPSMFFQWKHWPRYKDYAARVARLSEAFSGGKRVCDIALVHPGAEFQSEYRADPAFKTGYFRKGPAISNSRALALESWFQKTGQSLNMQHLDFDVVPSPPKGYRHVLKAGALVGAGRWPVLPLKGRDIRLSGSPHLKGKVFEWDTRIHDPYLHQNLDRILKDHSGGVTAMHYRKKGEDLYFLANLTRKKLSFKAGLRCRAPKVELRWPGNGHVENAPFKRAGASTTLKLSLPPLESVIVAFIK